MSINPEQWKQRRAQKEQQRKEKEARQRKLLIRIGIAVAAAAVGIALVFFLINRFSGSAPAEPTAPDASAATELGDVTATVPTEEEAPQDDNVTTIHVVAAGDVNVTDNVIQAGGFNYDYTDVFMDIAYLFGDADLAMVNLEGNLCGAPYGSLSRSAPQGLVEALDRAGVDMVQLANS